MALRVNLVMTVIGFTVSTMFIVFVCTRLIWARIRYLSTRRSFRLSSRSDITSLERGLRGVEPIIIANFPTKKFNDPFFSCTVDAVCTVCLSEFHEEDTLRILPFCGHFFHLTCIDIWLQQHCTCPVCRVSLLELSAMQLVSSSAAAHSSMESQPEGTENDLILNEGGSNMRDMRKKEDESTSSA